MRGTAPVAIGVLLTVAAPVAAADAASGAVSPVRRYEHLENPELSPRGGAGAVAVLGDARRVRAERPRCALLDAGADRSSTEGCLGCHPEAAGRNKHPVGVDYGAAAAAKAESLRSREEVTARGLLLPGGAVECTTCHDGRSTAVYRLALPARGASPSPPAWPGWPRIAVPASLPGGGPEARALCVACHTVADGPPDA